MIIFFAHLYCSPGSRSTLTLVAHTVFCGGFIVLSLFAQKAIWIWEKHFPVHLRVQVGIVHAWVRACVPVFVWPQIVVSCEWTWLRRRYQGKNRNREWWFTGYFLYEAFIPPPHPLVSTSPLPCLKATTREITTPVYAEAKIPTAILSPRTMTVARVPLLSNIFNIKWDLYQRWSWGAGAVSRLQTSVFSARGYK